MRDPRYKELAKNIVNYSTELKPNEKVLIELIGGGNELAQELISEIQSKNAIPFMNITDPKLTASLLRSVTDEQLLMNASWERDRMAQMDAYIGIRAGNNSFDMKNVPHENIELQQKLWWKPVHGEIRVPKTKWVIMRYPNDSMAQLAKMPTEEFEDYYFSVCNIDYNAMSAAMDPLVELLNKTDAVRIVGKNTDINFSIKDIPVVKCDGQRNIPDGEVYTAPVKDSINGVITYNAPSPQNGFTFENVQLTFKNGKIVNAISNDTERINQIFDTDEGSRYVGEFAFGLNPAINQPIGDILFDEKIGGSIHLTPGSCYDEADNGNKSAIHWDLVHIQTPEYGGGEIYLDDILVRKDGLFVLDSLKSLNPKGESNL